MSGMVRPGSVLITLAALAAALSGCGGGSTPARTTTTATTGAARAAAPPAHQDPRTTLRAARSALVGLRSYHVAGSQTDPDGTTALDGDVTAKGDLRMTLHQHGTSAQLIVVRRSVFLRAGIPFWRYSHLSERLASAVADRWIKAPDDHGIAKLSDEVRPATLAHCLQGGGDELSDAGLRTFQGKRVRVIAIAGKAPGSAPGSLFVAATGPQLPVRVLQTGPSRPGGKLDPRCDDPSKPDRSTHSDIRLSRFDEPLSVTAPPNALDLQALAAQLQGATPS
jgi:hypothetical protein